MKILIVDDDNVSRRLIESILNANGYETLPANSVKNAIEYFDAGTKISLVILDINMPEYDGFSLLKYLHANPHLERIPVIMCSSAEDEVSVVNSIKLGAVGYIKKPVTSKVLMPKVVEAIGQYQRTVVIVDDEELIRTLLRATLEREGFNAISADSGENALEVLKSQHIDAVITDIQMGRMSGLDLLSEIKSKYEEIPVLIITGHSDRFSKRDILAAGADGFIGKPFKNLEIIKALKDVLRKCHVH